MVPQISRSIGEMWGATVGRSLEPQTEPIYALFKTQILAASTVSAIHKTSAPNK
jgi:hypothetical protein